MAWVIVSRCGHPCSPARRFRSSIQIATLRMGSPFGGFRPPPPLHGVPTPHHLFRIGVGAPPPPFLHGVPFCHDPSSSSHPLPLPFPSPPSSSSRRHLCMESCHPTNFRLISLPGVAVRCPLPSPLPPFVHGCGACGDPFFLDFPLLRRMGCPRRSHLQIVLGAISSPIRAWGSRYGVTFWGYFIAPPPFLHNKFFNR